MTDWSTRVERAVAPPDAVRSRIVDGLRREGLLAPKRGVARRSIQAAAALLLFAAGWMAGAAYDARAVPSQPRYMLLLFGETSAPADVEARVAEYGAWAQAARTRGERASGERLGRARMSVGAPAPAADQSFGGFFIVEAPSMDAARAVAEDHPHVRHGGTIVIRPIIES